MKVLFKNLGILILFLGLIPFLLMLGYGFKLETFIMGLFCITLGWVIYKVNIDKNKVFVLEGEDDEFDNDFTSAKRFVVTTGKASISEIQSRFYWGYNRAASAMEDLERNGIVSPIIKGERYRRVLIKNN